MDSPLREGKGVRGCLSVIKETFFNFFFFFFIPLSRVEMGGLKALVDFQLKKDFFSVKFLSMFGSCKRFLHL